MEKGTLTKLACVIPALVAGALALSLGTLQISAAQDLARPEVQPKKAEPSEKIKKTSPAVAETKKSTPAAVVAKKSDPAVAGTTKLHRLAVQVNANEPAAMNLALNNASNVAEY